MFSAGTEMQSRFPTSNPQNTETWEPSDSSFCWTCSSATQDHSFRIWLKFQWTSALFLCMSVWLTDIVAVYLHTVCVVYQQRVKVAHHAVYSLHDCHRALYYLKAQICEEIKGFIWNYFWWQTQWMNEWMVERMNELMNEWTNERNKQMRNNHCK